MIPRVAAYRQTLRPFVREINTPVPFTALSEGSRLWANSFRGRAVRKRPVTRMSPGRFLLQRPGIMLTALSGRVYLLEA